MNDRHSRLRLGPSPLGGPPLFTDFVSLLETSMSWRQAEGGNIEIPDRVSRHFDPEPDAAEKLRRLAEWRAASPEEKAALARTRWTAKNWLHWFAHEPSWRIVAVSRTDDSVEVVIAHDDDPVPVSALEWTAGLYNLSILHIDAS